MNAGLEHRPDMVGERIARHPPTTTTARETTATKSFASYRASRVGGDLSLPTAAGQVNCHKGNTFCFVNFKIYADTWQSLCQWRGGKGQERRGGRWKGSSAVCRSGSVNYLVLAGELLLPLKLHVFFACYRCFIMSYPSPPLPSHTVWFLPSAHAAAVAKCILEDVDIKAPDP